MSTEIEEIEAAEAEAKAARQEYQRARTRLYYANRKYDEVLRARNERLSGRASEKTSEGAK